MKLLSSLSALALSLSVCAPLAAQNVQPDRLGRVELHPQTASAKNDVRPRRIHITDDLLRSPEGLEALRNYHRYKQAGLLPAGKRAAVSYQIGETKDFNIQTNLGAQTVTWQAVNFTLRAENDVANVWVETSLDTTIDAEQMDELEAQILSETPEKSFRPDRGIIENNNEVFGHPPDGLDTDGKVDILLHDIEEADGAGCCVFGYVTTVDLNPEAPEGRGNQSNILYVDLPDAIKGGIKWIAGTIAHEYQHLIHYEYQDINFANPNPETIELTFVNEGLSEWAEVINGYFLRAINYLGDPDEHNTALLDFGTGDFGARDPDYQRAGLFTTYLAERLGREATGSILQARNSSGRYAIGADGYEAVLMDNGLSLDAVLADFHTANFVNDQSLDPRFGYSLPERQSLTVNPTLEYDGAAQNSSSGSISMLPGAVQYVSWTNVSDLDLTVSDHPESAPGARSSTNFRLLADPVVGPRMVVDLGSDVTNHQLTGDFEEVTLIASNTNLSGTGQARFNVAGTWEELGSGGVSIELIAHENGTADSLFVGVGNGFRQANRFDVPPNARLVKVYLAPVYENEFGNTGVPSGVTRDFVLEIFADDGSGRPGAELYQQDITDNPVGSNMNWPVFAYKFLEYEIPAEAMPNLPETIYISIGNSGADLNYLVVTASETTEKDVSFIFWPDDQEWAPLTSISTDGIASAFPNHALPIRAEFAISEPVADENPVELPREVSLDQNYPNPFNPSSRISYSLPRAMRVNLSVYNVLGQRVATLVEGTRPAGVHEVDVDASGWASGVYLYTLTTEQETRSQRMIVLK